jgi:N-acetylglucosaminyldiphosphoundecaprenol N-acetyl-beta-D-mannosaminyltransferase
VGTHHGYFDQDAASAENAAVIAAINAAAPQLLLVGFGMPRQERWLAENRARLTVNVALTVGALFEYVAGTLPRGPRWATEHYLEWLARWWLSPRRYTRRYLHDNPLFLARILRQRWGLG